MYVTHPVIGVPRIVDTAPVPAPSGDALARVDSNWEREKAECPALYNGKIFSIESIEGSSVTGFMGDYAWHLAQLRDPSLHSELRMRSLAVSGLVVAKGHVIFGRRKLSLAVEGGLWETAPSGTLHDLREADGSLSWRKVFLEELREELHIAPPPMMPRVFALVEDTETNVWEMGVAIELDMDHRSVLASWVASPNPEHSELAAVPVEDVPKFIKVRGKEMVGACPHLLAAYGLAGK